MASNITPLIANKALYIQDIQKGVYYILYRLE
jgi:hypothetical protein